MGAQQGRRIRRLAAAVLLGALVPVNALTGEAPAVAGPGVDITPPAVGSCHDLTYEDAYGLSDEKPAVDCGDPHTTRTVAVVELEAEPRNWAGPSVWREVGGTCTRGMVAALGGNPERVQRSAYGIFYFVPTVEQREAGALWVRCDVVRSGRSDILPLPRRLRLPALPLPDALARCRLTEAGNRIVELACTEQHDYRVRRTAEYPGRHPGRERLADWARRQCGAERGGRDEGLYEVPTGAEWRAGLRLAVCYRDTYR